MYGLSEVPMSKLSLKIAEVNIVLISRVSRGRLGGGGGSEVGKSIQKIASSPSQVKSSQTC
jgi:hypothetical protein